MKKLLLIFSLFLFVPLCSAEELPPLRGADTWFVPPAKGQKTHDSNWKVMLWRADKRRPSPYWRYYPHITNREYIDCSYYKYVNCEDFRFCRCWQCRDYIYGFEYDDL